MTVEQLKQIIKILKIQIPTITEPTDDTQWAVIGGMFANLSFGIATKVIANIKDENIDNLKKAPYITLKKMIVDQTDFDRQEKEQYKLGYEVYYAVDIYKGMMLAYNKKNGVAVPEKTRKMTALEEDYYLYNLMNEEEFRFCNKQTEISPKYKYYNPQTRKNEKYTNKEFLNNNTLWEFEVAERRRRAEREA